jgi:transposase
VVEPVGAVTGADGHRENRPALRRGSAVGHGAAPLGCAARKNGTWRRLPNRRTPLPRLGDRGPDERQRSAEAQRVDCVRIVQTVRNGVRAFNAGGLAALTAGSSRPKSAAPVLGAAERERLRAILHQPPRAFGHARSTWTLDLLAREAHGQGLSPTVLSGETVRQALLRLGAGWKRAKRWLTSPDPAYAQKNAGATG